MKKREGFKPSEQKRMMLSAETLLGLRITSKSCQAFNMITRLCHSLAKSFLHLVRYIFKLPGVSAFLSRKLCQDPVEKFFGCQRQRGGTNENPTVAEFCKNTQAPASNR